MATTNITTQGTKTAAGIVNFDPNTGQRLSAGQSVAVNQGGNTYGSVAVQNQSVPVYGSDVKNAQGQVIGQAKFNPNTGQSLQTPNTPVTPQSITGTTPVIDSIPTQAQQPQTIPTGNLASDLLSTQQTTQTPEQIASQTRNAREVSLIGQTAGKAQAKTQALQDAGVPQLQQQLQGYSNQINDKVSKLQQFDSQNQQIQQNISNQPIAMGFVTGQQAAQQRQSAITRGSMVAEI